ncbi:hypothetical protein BZA05DRAFT_74554 [Tricharina praecox]|uniref:uncharacterized protein n=1 Tax=Tricharina praecox TaxID=43433 RepID=UPI0022212866|nr:uncharacterized protein BZA05DRAFT_74554 [Tricharina praecox]KAI5849701.1 hypothetical protein BZA05DRAFT_74554 [Tricharina praecox]
MLFLLCWVACMSPTVGTSRFSHSIFLVFKNGLVAVQTCLIFSSFLFWIMPWVLFSFRVCFYCIHLLSMSPISKSIQSSDHQARSCDGEEKKVNWHSTPICACIARRVDFLPREDQIRQKNYHSSRCHCRCAACAWLGRPDGGAT